MESAAVFLLGGIFTAAVIFLADYLAEARVSRTREALDDAYTVITEMATRLTDPIAAATVDHQITQANSVTAAQMAFQMGINPDEEPPPPVGEATAMGVNGDTGYSGRDLEDIV